MTSSNLFHSDSHTPEGPFMLLLPYIIRSNASAFIVSLGKALKENVALF